MKYLNTMSTLQTDLHILISMRTENQISLEALKGNPEATKVLKEREQDLTEQINQLDSEIKELQEKLLRR